MSTPLFDALARYARSEPLRLHMPGHKGRLSGPLGDFSALDATELPPIGDLYAGQGQVTEAERLFARAGGAKDALFFSCGATQGIFTMLCAAVGAGGTLLLDRGCHKSVYHGMALLDITPVYLQPPLLPGTSLPAPLDPDRLESALCAHPEARAVFLTSPSYYGILTPLRPLAEICRRHGVFLLVDQAHGAHFPWVGLPTAAQEGAHLSVVSAHKTLPALGGSAVLYLGEDAPWDRLRLKTFSGYASTTSPSWPILASIDLARAKLETSRDYAAMAAEVSRLRDRINRETPFRALTEETGAALDPCRLTVDTAMGGLSGHGADRQLQDRSIFVEMADERYLVSIVTCMDRPEDLERFLSGLRALTPEEPEAPDCAPVPPESHARMSLRAALFGETETLPLQAAAGRISAQIVAPYPPGIPVLAPGEEITQKHIAYLQKKSYNIEKTIQVTL